MVVAPLTTLASTLQPFCWTIEKEAAFTLLASLFTSALTWPIQTQTTNSLERLTSQHPSLAEEKYDVGTQELLTVVFALQEWRHWLVKSVQLFVVWTVHKNLTYLCIAKQLNLWQVQWVLFLGHINFTLTYQPSSRNVKVNALSHQFSQDPSNSDPDPIPLVYCWHNSWLVEARV